VTSRICTANNRFKRSKKKVCFQRIFVGKQKTFTIFWGTIHGSHRESKLGLQRLKKWVFAWILKKINSERKRVWPHTDLRSQRLVVHIYQNDITGVETPSNFIYYILFPDTDEEVVDYDSQVVSTFDCQVEDGVIDSHPVQPKCWICIFEWQSFPKLLVLLYKMHDVA